MSQTDWLASVGYTFCSKYRHLGACSALPCLIFHGKNCLDEIYFPELINRLQLMAPGQLVTSILKKSQVLENYLQLSRDKHLVSIHLQQVIG